MHFESVWPQFQILIMSPAALARLIKTRKNNCKPEWTTKHLAVSKYHSTQQMTFCLSQKHRLWKNAKETRRCVIISFSADMHSHIFPLCGSVRYERWRWATHESLNPKETHVKGEYESKHILTWTQGIFFFLHWMILCECGYNVLSLYGVIEWLSEFETEFVVFHMHKFLIWYQKSLSCRKDRNLKDMIYFL